MPPDRAEVRRQLDRAVTTDHFKLRPAAFSDRELLDMVGLARRHLAEAEWMRDIGHPILASQLARAYDGCVVAASSLIAAYGYRSWGEAGHEQGFAAARGIMHLLGREDVNELIDRARDVLRPARHEAQYESLAVDPRVVATALATAAQMVPALTGEAAQARNLSVPDFDWGLSARPSVPVEKVEPPD